VSVLEYNGAAAASAVIMSHEMRSKKIMFVEGIHDGRLFSYIFGENFLCVAAKGMKGVIDALDVIAEYNSRSEHVIDVIGFIDKDYLHLSDESCILERSDILTTQYRDIEIDLFHTEALKRFLEEKASTGKWKCENQVIEDILNSLSIVSFLRAYNAAKKKGWDFKTLDLCRYVDTLGMIQQQRLESAFRQKNHISNEEWQEFEEWMTSIDICIKTITRGHDVACVIGQMLRKSLGNRKKEEASAEIVEENLRLAVERKFIEVLEWFEKTIDWTHNNQLQPVHRNDQAAVA
jgi:hypothetical protein